jgi:DNA-binding NtrC family response regulator
MWPAVNGNGTCDVAELPAGNTVPIVVPQPRFEREVIDDALPFGRFVGSSPAMLKLYELLERVGPSEVPVLLVGESGTGKELAARTLHDLSPRRDGPFIAVNAGAIPSTMVESELFGHERGSFTGAIQRHVGYFERARGGTLLLDEFTEMSPDLQVKLLRVLESDTLQRVGGERDVPFDVRIIAATNASPEEAIVRGRLRKDLYFRLGVFRVDLPPLRTRADDVKLLAEHFVSRLNRQFGTGKRLADGALQALAGHSWPGNVRELRNLVHASYIVANDVISLRGFEMETQIDIGSNNGTSTLTLEAHPSGDGKTVVIPVGTTAAEAERQLIMATLQSCGGNKNKAARTLGLSLKTIYNRLNAYRATSQGARVA